MPIGFLIAASRHAGWCAPSDEAGSIAEVGPGRPHCHPASSIREELVKSYRVTHMALEKLTQDNQVALIAIYKPRAESRLQAKYRVMDTPISITRLLSPRF